MQKPGILNELNLSNLGSSEEEIIKKFATVWFITFIRKIEFKLSEYAFVFAKPTDEIKENFHLDREVLVIFSKYRDFDTRTLDVVENHE